MTSDPVINTLIERLQDRSVLGMQTYGMSLAKNPASMLFWIDSTIEELLDAAAYLERMKLEIGKETKRASLDE